MTTHALHRLDVLRAARDAAGAMLVGLDFDGTLAPIVPQPADAHLLPAARPALEALAARSDTRVALVSGRSIDDLRKRIGIDTVYYAGNHGLEIDGPGVHRIEPAATGTRSVLAGAANELEIALADIPGVIIEDKHLSLSVHFRTVYDPAVEQRVYDIVHERFGGTPGVRLTDGRKVVEVRPDVDWHKGRAFQFIRETIESRFGAGPAVFIGDDRTDEDAFLELGATDCAIIVGDPPAYPSSARTGLRSPDEVAQFLQLLALDDDS